MSHDIRRFFDDYNASFVKGPSSIAEFYHEPCVTARMGTPTLNLTRRDCEVFFASVLEKYKARGWSRGELQKLEFQALGTNSVLATILWAYKDGAGKTLWEWTFSYNRLITEFSGMVHWPGPDQACRSRRGCARGSSRSYGSPARLTSSLG